MTITHWTHTLFTLAKKLFIWFLLIFKNPKEMVYRLFFVVERITDKKKPMSELYVEHDLHSVLLDLDQLFNGSILDFMNEDALFEIEAIVKNKINALPENAPFSLRHNTDFALARLAYCLCRTLKPEVIIETGVAYGVTTAFLLQGLDQNGKGHLHSIDLPPISNNSDNFVGILVPEKLKGSWSLHRGTSRELLFSVANNQSNVNLFIHDSLHTYSNMMFEFQTIYKHLSRPSVILSDDIQGNSAFNDFVKIYSPTYWNVIRAQEVEGNKCGCCVFLAD